MRHTKVTTLVELDMLFVEPNVIGTPETKPSGCSTKFNQKRVQLVISLSRMQSIYVSRPKHQAYLITSEDSINYRVDLIIASKGWNTTIVSTMYHIIKGFF